MFPRNTYSAERKDAGILGWKLAKTPSRVSSVSRLCRS
jgi:hypothetical protein